MKKFKLIIGFLFFSIIACKEENGKNSKIEDMKTNNQIEELLNKQLKAGYTAEKSETDYKNYTFQETDLNISNEIIKDYLTRNGYIPAENNVFAEKIKNVFNITLDHNSDKTNVILNFSNPCNRDLNFNKNEGDELNDYCIYISKNQNFISELFSIPEILDYQKIYPESAKLEVSLANESNGIKIYKWSEKKDLTNLRELNLKKILYRNKFLFNASDEAVNWLIENDVNFLKKLLLTYGFDKNDKINQKILSQTFDELVNLTPNQTDKIGELFFKKDCDAKLQIRKNLLNYVEKTTSKGDNRFLYSLIDYVNIVFDGDLNNVYNNDPSKEFNEEEKALILSTIGEMDIRLTSKYKSLNPDVWNNEGSLFYNIINSNPKILKIIEANNFFGIPNLKEKIGAITNEIEATSDR
ncbi:hypothetical protein FLACOL_01712 [Flavobacterium columnare]|uniref:Lipoprotein n=1 Tax=Flavobacterium columnare TaxID=996 RepID=A0A2N9PBK3_9FLAO|nr:hypothetical protein [Flavobacterium columnare]SPE77707.1 hypothetical protein FLACOL_01712 [Flavobacterium columnare]